MQFSWLAGELYRQGKNELGWWMLNGGRQVEEMDKREDKIQTESMDLEECSDADHDMKYTIQLIQS